MITHILPILGLFGYLTEFRVFIGVKFRSSLNGGFSVDSIPIYLCE